MPGCVEDDVGLDSDVEPVIRLGHESGPNRSRIMTRSAEAAGDRPVRGEEDERGGRRNDDPSTLESEFCRASHKASDDVRGRLFTNFSPQPPLRDQLGAFSPCFWMR